MRILFLILFLLFPSLVYSAPSTTLSVSPAAVDATTITASDENTRNSAVSTWANAHDHNDIDQTANTLAVGDAAAGNKTIQANNADTNKPFIRYDDTNNRWVGSKDGSAVESFIIVTGATAGSYVFPQSPAVGDSLIYDDYTSTWKNVSVRYVVGTFSRDISTASGTQAITGLGFRPTAVMFSGQVTSYGFTLGVTNTTSGFGTIIRGVAPDYVNGGAQFIHFLSGADEAYVDAISMGSDGFTLTWTKVGSPTGTAVINYMAFR